MSYLRVVFRLLSYIVIIFSFLFLTNNKIIGPLCARHICGLLLLCYAIIHKNRIIIDKYEKHYFIYVSIYLIASIVNTELFRSDYISNFISYYFSAFVLIVALPTTITSKEHINIFLTAILITFLSNSALTICQFLNFQWAWDIGVMANAGLLREMDINSWLFESDDADFLGRTITAGFTGFVVTNGYFTTSYFPLSLYKCEQITCRRIMTIITIAICIVTTFVNQQRAGFAFVSLFLIFYLIFIYKGQFKRVVIISLIIISIYVIPFLVSTFEFGRLLNFHDATRNSLYDDFFDFIMTFDAFFGGYYNYMEKYGIMQHNSIMGAWIVSGLIGFLCFILLYIRFIIRLSKKVFAYIFLSKYSKIELYLSVSCLMYLVYSLTHASGLHNDGMMFWIPYTLLVSYEKLNKINNNNIY